MTPPAGHGGRWRRPKRRLASPASPLLAVLALSYQLASLMRFWGARIAASRIFFGIGIVWICPAVPAFALLLERPEPDGLLGLERR